MELTKLSTKQLFYLSFGTPLAVGALLLIAFFAKDISLFSRGDGGVHIRGNKNAAVKIVEYSDFQCPFCERHYPNIKRLQEEYGTKVSVEYKHFPLSFHPFAEPTAEASECAAEQGKFWEFHDLAFENQSSLSASSPAEWAQKLGLNMTQFNQCVATHKYQAKVQAEYKQGAAVGVDGTPATFVNGALISGAVPYEQLKSAVDAALGK